MFKSLKNLPHKGVALALIVVVLAALYWQSQGEYEFAPIAQGDDPVDDRARYPNVEPAMLAAFIKAQATLSEFLELAESPPEQSKSFAVKVQISEGDVTEYLWVYPFEEKAGAFTGRLNEKPQQLAGLDEGEEISFKRNDIVDWTFDNRATKTMEGNFTGCVALAREAPEHVEQFQELYGLNCDR